MILKEKVPGLADALDGYARALNAGDSAAAEKFVAERARDAHRAMFAELKRKNVLGTCEELALAKIGNQYMSKVRIERGAESAVLLNRWAQDERAGWKIAACEDISAMRSPWSKIPELKDAQVER
jgi:hypothetical protein